MLYFQLMLIIECLCSQRAAIFVDTKNVFLLLNNNRTTGAGLAGQTWLDHFLP